ncbi:MAG: hypothetical protein M3237_16800 [Actinomycetota bacterium]|nr:hypothetical protein [Actinomycetota bacterium]
MRASELLGRSVVEGAEQIGIVHDVQLRLEDDGSLWLTALVVGPPGMRIRIAHAWGYAQDRAGGPVLLRRWAMSGGRARAVPVSRVRSWDEGDAVVLAGERVSR